MYATPFYSRIVSQVTHGYADCAPSDTQGQPSSFDPIRGK